MTPEYNRNQKALLTVTVDSDQLEPSEFSNAIR